MLFRYEIMYTLLFSHAPCVFSNWYQVVFNIISIFTLVCYAVLLWKSLSNLNAEIKICSIKKQSNWIVWLIYLFKLFYLDFIDVLCVHIIVCANMG